MGFFEDIFGTAKKIVNSGKDVLRDQLGSKVTYERGIGITSATDEKIAPFIFGDKAPTVSVPQAFDTARKIAPFIFGDKAPTVSVPQAFDTARKIALGETPRERFDRIQSERRQTLLPAEAKRAVAEDAGSELFVASGGTTPDGGYDPDKVSLMGIPFAGTVKKAAKATLGRLNLKPKETDIVEQFIDITRGTSKLDKETQMSVRQAAQSVADRLDLPEKAAGDTGLANAFERIVQNKGDAVVPPARPPKDSVTTPTNPNEFERSFSKRVREANPDANLTPQMDVRRSTPELSAQADEIINRGEQFTYIDDIKAGRDISDEHIAVASQLLNRYSDELKTVGDQARRNEIYESMADVAHETAARLTEAGRTVQAATILGQVTPEGTLRRAAREINKWNSENPNKKIPGLSGEQTRFIFEEKKVINNMPMGEERAMREFFLNNYIEGLTPSTKGEMVSNVWKAGLLTGIKTSGLNIASNLAHNVLEIIKDVPSVGVDIMASLFTGERTTALTTRGLASGSVEGFGKGWKYLLTGFDARNVGEKLDYKPLNFGNSKAGKAFQAYTNAVFRTIGSQDQPFYYAAAKHSLWSQALAQARNKGLRGEELLTFAQNLVDNPTDEIIKRATTDAQIAVFQNKTELGRLARGIQQVKIAGIPVGQFVVPFAQTPSAVAMQILNYSPVGAVKTIIQNIGKGNFDQRAFSQGIGRSIVGTAPLVIGAEMYKNGLIQLEYPSGNEREIELNKAEGRTYNAFRTSPDGDWRSVISLGPAGNLLLFGAYFQKALDESGSLSEALYTGGFGALSSFTEQTFLTGFNRFTEFIQDPIRYGESYLPSLAASAIPTIVSDVAKAGDPLQRNARGDGFVDNFRTRAMNRIPGLREQLPAQVDALGNQVPRGAGPIESMIDPTRPSEDISTTVTQELRRLTEAGYAVAPTKIGTSQGYDSLSPQEEQQFFETVGSLVNDNLEILISDPLYQQLNDGQRESLIKKITDKSKDKAAAIFLLQQTDGVPIELQADILLKYKEDGILNTDVFRYYRELISDNSTQRRETSSMGQ